MISVITYWPLNVIVFCVLLSDVAALFSDVVNFRYVVLSQCEVYLHQ